MITATNLYLTMRASYAFASLLQDAVTADVLKAVRKLVPPEHQADAACDEDLEAALFANHYLTEDHVRKAASMDPAQALLFVQMLDSEKHGLTVSGVVCYNMVDRLLHAVSQAIQKDPSFEELTFPSAIAAGYPAWFIRSYLAAGQSRSV